MTTKRLLLFTALACSSLTLQAQFSGSGSGTQKDPYLVTTEDELFEIRNSPSSHYKLMNDIDLTEWLAEEYPSQGWLPVPNFSGTFDGNNHSISGLFINRPSTSNVGLFGSLTGTITNLTLVSPNVTGNASTGALAGTGPMTLEGITVTNATIEGNLYVGGIVGACGEGGSLSNLKVEVAEISGQNYVGGCVGYTENTISQSYAKDIVITGTSYLGGLAGRVRNATDNIVFGVRISGSDYIGGLVGHLYYGSITDSFVFNCNLSGTNCLGGIAGMADAPYAMNYYNEIRRCYASGNIICSGTGTQTYAGGIAAYLTRQSSNSGAYRIRDCRFDGHIRGSAYYAGGIFGSGTYAGNGSYCGLNIVSGSIYGKGMVYGIAPSVNTYTVCCADTVYSTNGTAYRAGAGSSYAYNGMVVYSNNKKVEVEDGGGQGEGYSLRLLKKASSYIGLTFDFDNVWTIDEGNSFPYLIGQSTPPTITSCISGTNATIKGTAPEDGTVHVFVGNKLYEGTIVSGQWNVKLSELEEGTVVNTYVVATGKKPSVMVSCIAESRGLYVELDETSNEMPEAATGVDVHVTRTIKANEWSTICLPFAMTTEQCRAAFGSDVQLGDFAGYETSEDGEGNIVGITVNFNTATAIEANHPYVIKVSQAVSEFTLDGVDIDPQEAKVEFDNGKTGKQRKVLGTFAGTYTADFDFYNEATSYPLFLNGGKFYYATVNTMHMKAFRAYFDFVDYLEEAEAAGAPVFVSFNENTTGIDNVKVETPCDNRYYNLNGQQVEQPTKGLYIKNGKKVIVK